MNSTLFQEARALFCSACRAGQDESASVLPLKRCGRCKLTQYCSVKCQKQHFFLHKNLCKRIHELRDMETEIVCDNNTHHGTDSFTQIKTELARCSFNAAYQSCDTLERGASMMEISLRHYFDMIPTIPSVFLQHFHVVSLLLVALNNDMEALSLINYYHQYYSHVIDPEQRLLLEDKMINNYTANNVGWIVPLQNVTMEISSDPNMKPNNISMVSLILMLIIKMKLMIQLRTKKHNKGQDDAAIQQQQVKFLVDSIHCRDPLILFHIRDSIPLTFNDVPELVDDFAGIQEHLLLLQDCFFLSPGVRSLLDDFVQDDEEIDDSSIENPTDLLD